MSALFNSILRKLRRRDRRGWALPLAVLLTWYLATHFAWVNTRLIVPPGNVLAEAWHTIARGSFLDDVAASLARDLGGFILGSAAGIALGTLLGMSRYAERFFGPSFHALRQISLFAWLPLVTSWLGNGNEAKVLFVAVSAFYPVTLGALEGVRGISAAHAEVVRVFAFTRWQCLTRLVLPGAAPQIFTGLRLGLMYAWLGTIGAEYLLPKDGIGIGNTVIKGRAAFNIELLVVGLLAIGIIGAMLARIASHIETRSLRWRLTR